MTMPYQPGDWIDGWIVDRVLGLGSAGGVYACHKEVIPDLTVAMKTLVDPEPEVVDAFAELGHKLFAVHHPNVVRVRDIRAYDAPRFMLTELVEGEPLSEYVRRRGALNHGRALTFARQLAEAIEAIHKQGIAHCDITPANLIVSPDGDRITLVDFGTLPHRDAARLTRRGKIKPALAVYAPPEWMDGKADPFRWDMYSLGAVIHEMLTGKPPVVPASEAQGQLLQAIAIKRKTPYHDPGEGYPDELREVVRWCTKSDWGARPDNAREVIWSLEDFLDRTEINPGSIIPAALRDARPPAADDFEDQPPTVVGGMAGPEPEPKPTPRAAPAPPPAPQAPPPAPIPPPEPVVVQAPGPPTVMVAASLGLGVLGAICLVVSLLLVMISLPGLRRQAIAPAAPAASVASAEAPQAAPAPEATPAPAAVPEPEPEPTGPRIVEDDLPSDYRAGSDGKKAYLAIEPPEGVKVEVFFLRDGEPDASIGYAPFRGSKYERGLRPFFPDLIRGIRVTNAKEGIDESWDPHELQAGKALRWEVQP